MPYLRILSLNKVFVNIYDYENEYLINQYDYENNI